MPRLEDWAVTFREFDPYKAPEQQRSSLCGNVYGHEKFPDGQYIVTSYVVNVNDEKEEITTRSGTVYTLGETSAAYEKKFPDARKRVFGKK